MAMGRVQSNMISCQTALVIISCNHDYFLLPITFIFRIRADDNPPLAKKARKDPFADMRDGNTTNEHESTNRSRASGREELARYKAMRVPAKHSSPLEFWKENGREFPLLAIKLPGASSASQLALPSRRETFQRSAVPLLTLVQGCRRKLLKQWNSFVGQCVVHCLTWMTNYLI